MRPVTVDPFRGSERPTLGVELELQLVDAESCDLVPVAEDVMARVPPGLRDSVKPEFFPCCVEVNTGVCRDVEEVGHDLAPKLDAAAEAAAGCRARLAW